MGKFISKSIKWNHADNILQFIFCYCRKKKDLPELSKLGHFLKGSSAAIGVVKVKNICENIQNWGVCKEGDGKGEIKEDKALELIITGIADSRKDFAEAETVLKKVKKEKKKQVRN